MPVRADTPLSIRPTKVRIIIYICPTVGCGNFYAAPNFRPDNTDMEAKQTKRDLTKNVETHTRAECPACRIRDGSSVQRVPYVVTGVVSLDEMIKWNAKRKERDDDLSKGSDNKGVPVRSSALPTQPRREMQKPSRSFLSRRGAMLWAHSFGRFKRRNGR